VGLEFKLYHYRIAAHLASIFLGESVGFLISTNGPFPSDAFAGLNVYPAPGHLALDMYALAAYRRTAEYIFRLGQLCREYADLFHGKCGATAYTRRTDGGVGATLLLKPAIRLSRAPHPDP
jgi:hypothetical protein